MLITIHFYFNSEL